MSQFSAAFSLAGGSLPFGALAVILTQAPFLDDEGNGIRGKLITNAQDALVQDQFRGAVKLISKIGNQFHGLYAQCARFALKAGVQRPLQPFAHNIRNGGTFVRRDNAIQSFPFSLGEPDSQLARFGIGFLGPHGRCLIGQMTCIGQTGMRNTLRSPSSHHRSVNPSAPRDRYHFAIAKERFRG